jgi:hypothetical protein
MTSEPIRGLGREWAVGTWRKIAMSDLLKLRTSRSAVARSAHTAA